MKAVFSLASKISPSVVFVDEVGIIFQYFLLISFFIFFLLIMFSWNFVGLG